MNHLIIAYNTEALLLDPRLGAFSSIHIIRCLLARFFLPLSLKVLGGGSGLDYRTDHVVGNSFAYISNRVGLLPSADTTLCEGHQRLQAHRERRFCVPSPGIGRYRCITLPSRRQTTIHGPHALVRCSDLAEALLLHIGIVTAQMHSRDQRRGW
ncbi:hypothetical protein BC826DRAFT_737632 [Russula brevipes]|nr:hypothetical protein BC826DRAFT_737632 [Russula brevipes]